MSFDQAPSRPINFKRALIVLAFTALFVISWITIRVNPAALLDRESVEAVARFIRGLFPPDLTVEFLRTVAAASGQTVALALSGTVLSILLALPLGVLATPTLWRRGLLLAGERRNALTALLAALSRLSSGLLGFLRAVPDLMWGLFFVVGVGLGPLAGTLALGVSYAGMLGRVYADVFEDVDQRALEALHAAGASRSQVFLRAVWPQAAPSITGYTLYSFECCVRAASVLGFIGAGGIGYEINISMRLYQYGQVLTLMASLIVLVAMTDYISRGVRRRLHANAPAGALAHQRLNSGVAKSRFFIPGGKRRRELGVLAFGAVIFWSLGSVGLFSNWLSSGNALSRMSRFVSGLFPPDLSGAFLKSLGLPLLQTIGIALVGSVMGISIGAALSIPAASRLMLADDEESGDIGWLNRSVRSLVFWLARLVLSCLRSIPELVWVMICTLAVGLGPFAGALAIGLHTGGVLGKLYAETFEEAGAGPLEALRAGGARSAQVLFWGIIPQTWPTLVSYTVLRWEMNLRVSTILGLVGGGGLGQAIYNNVQLGFYPRVGTLIVITYLLVVLSDRMGDRLRSRRPGL
jgi:phosphonate transport system permease protein